MTASNPRPPQDITQAEHENDANAKRVVAFGKTTGGDYVELLVETDGRVVA